MDVYWVIEKQEKALQEEANDGFKFPFFLKTTNKVYELYCSTEEERKLWMTCVKYSIEYAKTVEHRRASQATNPLTETSEIIEKTKKEESPLEDICPKPKNQP